MKRPAFPTKDDLIHGWTDRHVEQVLDHGHWPDSLLDDIVDDFPEEAWSVILELMNRSHGTEAAGILAAGALENFVVRHGEQFVERIVATAAVDDKFRYLLSGIWQQRISEEVWGRIQLAVRGAPPNAEDQ